MTHAETVLIIASSGGGGLIQTANAKEQEIRTKNPSARIIRIDLLKDWIWCGLGHGAVHLYNFAQRIGNVFLLRACSAWQPIIDPCFWLPIFVNSLRLFSAENIDRVIDTQPMGTSALLKALAIFNQRSQKKILLEKVVVDLPTPAATHFFGPVKKLSPKERKLLKLVTIAPMLEPDQTDEQFWQMHCNLPISQVQVEEPYVRQAFTKYRKRTGARAPFTVPIHCKSDEELRLVQQCYQRGPIQSVVHGHHISFAIPPEAYIITLLLGSQPANDATLRYLELFRNRAKKSPKRPFYLFVFCANYTPKRPCLLRTVSKTVLQEQDHPPNLSIIPLSFQTEETIAALFFCSDLTCTRSGGQTAMELMRVSAAEIWIHSEAKHPATKEELLRGIIGWEAGSALYLERVIGAKIVTPESIC